LDSDKNWKEGISGCKFVVHTANPMPDTRDANGRIPDGDEGFVKPAREGMLRVLNATLEAKTVKRMVYLSSIGAMNWELWDRRNQDNRVVFSTGKDWTPTDGRCHVPSYIKSKSVAEKTAWEFVKKHKNPFELACVHPTLVLGPILSGRSPDSMQMLIAMLDGKYPIIPNLHWSIVDVRDVAQAIQKALKAPNANGGRFMLSGEGLWFLDVANLVKHLFPEHPVPSKVGPTFMIKALGLVDPLVRDFVAPICDVTRFVDVTPSLQDLGVVYHPGYETIRDGCQSLLDHGICKPPSKFRQIVHNYGPTVVSLGAAVGALAYFNHSGKLEGIKNKITTTIHKK